MTNQRFSGLAVDNFDYHHVVAVEADGVATPLTTPNGGRHHNWEELLGRYAC